MPRALFHQTGHGTTPSDMFWSLDERRQPRGMPRKMRAALVTGAAKRIGAAVATRLAADGWHVILHYATSEAEARKLDDELARGGATTTLLQADLSAADQHAGLIEAAFRAAPELELIVNNASAFRYDTLASASAQALSGCFAVNAIAPILLAQQFSAQLDAGRTGTIVNILDNRVFAPNPDYFSFGVSKFAMLGATRMMALALAPRIRVNGIAPGITLVSGEQTADNFAAAHGMNPLGRGCTPEEIAGAVAFIVATPAMTGTIITIDGGQTLANPGRDVAFISPGPPTVSPKPSP